MIKNPLELSRVYNIIVSVWWTQQGSGLKMSLDDTAVSFHVGWFGWVTDLFSERKYFLESATRLSLFGLSCLTRNLKRCPASFFTERGNYIGIISHHLYPILEKECGRNNIRKKTQTNQVHLEHLKLDYIWFSNLLCQIYFN